MANDDDTQYDRLAFKGSHNSYDRDEDLHEQMLWSKSQPYNGGCRALELDFTRHSVSGNKGTALEYFQVSHEQGGSGPPLGNYLGYLLSWHLADPEHDPIFVSFDIKSKEGDVSVFPNEFDNYLREWFSAEFIFTPAQVLVGGYDLVKSLREEEGWPEFSTLRGKFIFCLSGNGEWKKYYANDDLSKRLCFSDVEASSPITSGNRAIANLHLYSDDYDKWKKLVPDLHTHFFLVRGYVLNAEGIWDKAQGVGVNILATDKVRNYDWAQVGGGSPFAPVPG